MFILNIPQKSYGVLDKSTAREDVYCNVEEILTNGFTILEDCFSDVEINEFCDIFELVKDQYFEKYDLNYLRELDEHNTIRAPFLLDTSGSFVKLATPRKLLKLVSELINGSFHLSQQNGIINPSADVYNQGLWHRDLPYQHFISSTPLAINALYCVDDFTLENGSTFILPATHKTIPFPSNEFITKNAKQIVAKAGSYIVLDCMVYHSGGTNSSPFDRRGVNHVFTIPHIQKQIDYTLADVPHQVSDDVKHVFGNINQIPRDVSEYFGSR